MFMYVYNEYAPLKYLTGIYRNASKEVLRDIVTYKKKVVVFGQDFFVTKIVNMSVRIVVLRLCITDLRRFHWRCQIQVT